MHDPALCKPVALSPWISCSDLQIQFNNRCRFQQNPGDSEPGNIWTCIDPHTTKRHKTPIWTSLNIIGHQEDQLGNNWDMFYF